MNNAQTRNGIHNEEDELDKYSTEILDDLSSIRKELKEKDALFVNKIRELSFNVNNINAMKQEMSVAMDLITVQINLLVQEREKMSHMIQELEFLSEQQRAEVQKAELEHSKMVHEMEESVNSKSHEVVALLSASKQRTKAK